ncbi:tRNA pseudouridine synthase 1 [Friedmanniomyces endolithicus]|nr:tRNA pseudouridine synthase 1 [Friedmanniomyces endolithicus]KAK1050470.1 tRNA pseudouridine synthase 1 [Friedmanniomyces endolithicus]
MSVADPIVRLPPELTLRILEFAPISSLANLTAVSKAWHNFIDVTHQEAIYSKRTGTTGPHGSEDMTKVSSYSQYLESAESSKSLCQRQALLSRSWRSDRPMTTQTVLEPGGGGYFQFRADFTRRFFISTSEKGELNVTDMESGTLLWSLPSTLVSNVDSEQPCGLLEYEDGVAVFARDDNVLEVWQTDAGVLRRGEFRRWAVLKHEEEIWDAHIFGGVLRCVLSTGESLVYDLRRQAPKLTQRIQIAERDITYMCQDAKVVVYSMGRLGLYVHDQQSGELLGILKPSPEVSRYHILRPCHIRVRYQKLVPITVAAGPLPRYSHAVATTLEEDVWGACALDGNLMVCLSTTGFVYICPDWRQAVEGQHQHSAVIECQDGSYRFDFQSLLSVKNHRIAFVNQDWIYVVALDDEDRVQRPFAQSKDPSSRIWPSYAYLANEWVGNGDPTSCIALFNDCIMSTCAVDTPRPTPVHSNTAAGEEADDEIEDEVDDEVDDQTDDEVNDAADETTDNGSDDEDEDDGTYETRILRILSFAPQAEETHRPLGEAPTLSSDEMTASLTSQMDRWAVASLFDEEQRRRSRKTCSDGRSNLGRVKARGCEADVSLP